MESLLLTSSLSYNSWAINSTTTRQENVATLRSEDKPNTHFSCYLLKGLLAFH